MHDDEFLDTDKQMQWLLSYTKGVATHWAQPLLEALLDGSNRPEIASMDTLHSAFISHFGDPNTA